MGLSARRRRGHQPVLPSWIPTDHALYLNRFVCRRIRSQFDQGIAIFLNIPYSKRYFNLEVAIISTVTAYGLIPRMARERVHLETRLLKIAEFILSCRYGFTDLTYTTRMNMPLELGLLLAFGKETFVTSTKPYKALRSISDLNFGDIHYHRGSARKLIVALSRWVEQKCTRQRLTTDTLLQRYERVRQIRQALGEDWDKLKPEELPRFLGVLKDEFELILPGT